MQLQGDQDGDEVLEALAAVIDVLDDSGKGVDLARARAAELREGRAAGASYVELLTSAQGPLVVEVVTDLLEGLFAAGSRLRRAEVQALYAEGLSMAKISLLLRVSRQRVSALMRGTGDDPAPPSTRALRRSGGLALTGAEFRMIAESLPHIVWLASPDGEVEYLNRMGTEYTGLPLKASHGSGWVDQVHPDDRDRARHGWQEAVRTETAYVLDYRLLRFDGQARWHMCRSRPIKGPDGQVTCWIGTATDIDEQKHLEQDLRLAERVASEALALIEAMHHGAPVGFGLLDADLRVVRMNERLAAMAGSATAELGRPLADLLPALWTHLEEALQWVRDQGEPVVNVQVGGQRGEPAPGPSLASCYPVRLNGDLVGFGLVVVDLP